jgi:hypothetical protein
MAARGRPLAPGHEILDEHRERLEERREYGVTGRDEAEAED